MRLHSFAGGVHNPCESAQAVGVSGFESPLLSIRLENPSIPIPMRIVCGFGEERREKPGFGVLNTETHPSPR